jgi:hypothetical protein
MTHFHALVFVMDLIIKRLGPCLDSKTRRCENQMTTVGRKQDMAFQRQSWAADLNKLYVFRRRELNSFIILKDNFSS